MAEWLVEDLHEKYDVPLKVGQNWMDNGRILPLLDGLDEVALEHRGACAGAINGFRGLHGLLPIVVSSRLEDYEELAFRLKLPAALVIQPLSHEEAKKYFQQAGESLGDIHSLLQQDATLWELMDTPLMLNVMPGRCNRLL